MNIMKYKRKMQNGSGWKGLDIGILFSEIFYSMLEALVSFKQIWKGQTNYVEWWWTALGSQVIPTKQNFHRIADGAV